MAGIFASMGETCVVIDVDLQDQPELIADLYRKLREGYEVVYAQRRSRKGETAVKRLISYLGYATINRLSDVPIPRNTGDFRIMTQRVVEELRRLNESQGSCAGWLPMSDSSRPSSNTTVTSGSWAGEITADSPVRSGSD